MTIRFKFSILGSLAILLATLVTGVFSYVIVERRLTAKLKRFDLMNLARYKAEQIDSRVSRNIQTSILIAQDPLLHRWFKTREQDPLLHRLAMQRLLSVRYQAGYAQVFAASRITGNFYTGLRGKVDVMTRKDPDDSWFFDAISSRKPYLLNIDSNRELGSTYIWVNAQMGDPLNPIGVAGIGDDFTGFSRLFSAVDQYGGRSWMFDKSGVLQIAEDEKLIGRKIGQVFSPAVADAVAALPGNAGVLEYETRDGEDLFLAVAAVPQAGWNVVYEIPRAAVTGVLESIAVNSMLGGLVSIACMALVFYRGSRIILNPLKQLVQGFKEVSLGNLQYRLTRRSNDEFGELVTHFNVMSGHLQQYSMRMEAMVKERTKQLVHSEKMASLGELVAGVAHEINTPVGIGVTAASHARRKNEEILRKFLDGSMTKSDLHGYLEADSEALRLIQTNLDRAADLVQSFKQVAVDRKTEDLRTFNLCEYLDDVLLSLRPRYKRSGHSISVNCPKDLTVTSYPGVFSQIITNFVINSLVHGFREQESGEIDIHVHSVAGGIEIVYSDNGQGIPADYIEKVFDPFFTTRRHSGGTGLGLNIVYNLVTRTLGGSIRCESVAGEYTRFFVRIPQEGRDGTAQNIM